MRKYKNLYLNNQYLLFIQNELFCPYCFSSCQIETREADRWSDKEFVYTCFICDRFRIFFYPENLMEVILELDNYSLSYVWPHNDISLIDHDNHINLDWNISAPNLLNLQETIDSLELLKFYS